MSSPACTIGASPTPPLPTPPHAPARSAEAVPPAPPATLGGALCRLYAGLVFLR